jgi:predicted RNA binding protein YcfA (HicA-like mRNA interferase family)
MSPIPTVKARKLKSALLKKGFHPEHGKHECYYLHVDGKCEPVYTAMSHGETELGRDMVAIVRRELHLAPDEFEAFVKCPLNHEKYVRLLRSKGVLV